MLVKKYIYQLMTCLSPNYTNTYLFIEQDKWLFESKLQTSDFVSKPNLVCILNRNKFSFIYQISENHQLQRHFFNY